MASRDVTEVILKQDEIRLEDAAAFLQRKVTRRQRLHRFPLAWIPNLTITPIPHVKKKSDRK